MDIPASMHVDSPLGDTRQTIERRIRNLPPCEFKYHLLHLLYSLGHVEHAQTQAFLDQLSAFITEIEVYYQHNEQDPKALHAALNKLRHASGVYSIPQKIYRALLYIPGVILGLLLMIVGAIGGFFYGLMDAAAPQKPGSKARQFNPVLGAATGAIVWMCIAAMTGFRLIRKLFQPTQSRQVKYTLDRLTEDVAHLEKAHDAFKTCLENVERAIQDQFVSHQDPLDPPQKWHEIAETPIPVEIKKFQTSFFGQRSRGYFGSHAYAELTLFEKPYILELGAPPTPPSKKHATVAETRNMPLNQLIQLIAVHQYYSQFHDFPTFMYQAVDMKYGERDCNNYLASLLTAVNEKPHQISRFYNNPPGGESINRMRDYTACYREQASYDAVCGSGLTT